MAFSVSVRESSENFGEFIACKIVVFVPISASVFDVSVFVSSVNVMVAYQKQ